MAQNVGNEPEGNLLKATRDGLERFPPSLLNRQVRLGKRHALFGLRWVTRLLRATGMASIATIPVETARETPRVHSAPDVDPGLINPDNIEEWFS